MKQQFLVCKLLFLQNVFDLQNQKKVHFGLRNVYATLETNS